MSITNRHQISLYEEAKAGLNSLAKQTAQVGAGFLVMLLLTGGNPPVLTVGLSCIAGIAFVAWSEEKRLIKFRSSVSGENPVLHEQIQQQVKQLLEVNTNKLSELIKHTGFNPKEDLAGADLVGVEGAGCNLSGFNLSGAELREADLSHTNLSDANLSKADLSYANLSNANLSKADLSDANLSKADLSYANLSNANLSKADLSYANLSHAQIDDATKLDDKWHLVWKIVNHGTEGQNLSGANLSNAHLSGANLISANLTNANLSCANLSGANLIGANLRVTNLRVTNLIRANLSRANLSGANLSSANLNSANLEGTNLSGAKLNIANLEGTNLSGANLRNADLSDADLLKAKLSGTQIDDATKLDDKWHLVWKLSNRGTEGPDLSDALIREITEDNPAPKRKFLRIFSYNDKDEKTDKSTVIVLPAFDAEIVFPVSARKKIEVANQLASNTLKQKATENLSRSATKAAIKNDIIASSFIASSFLKTLLPQPQISWDEEKINFDDPEKITYILIGLSNSQIDNLSNQKITNKYFSIGTVTGEDNFHSFMLKCGHFDDSNTPRLSDDSQWHSYQEGDTFDYALFAKFEFGNKKILVCGGITEKSTNRAALYVSECWKRIYSILENEKGDSLDSDDSFAVVIEIPKIEVVKDEQFKGFVIKQVCIRKIA